MAKAEIDWLGKLFNILMVTDFALIGWLALNYDSANIYLLAVCPFAIIVLTVCVYAINHKVMKKIKSLEEL